MALRCLLAVGGLLLVVAVAEACKCGAPPPPKEALEASAAVFSGKVTKIVMVGEHDLDATFVVDQHWRGVTEKEVVVRTRNTLLCGCDFAKGTSYLVYATLRPDQGKDRHLFANRCTRTKPLTAAGDDLKELGEGKKF